MPPSKASNPALTLPRSLRVNRAAHPGLPDKPKPKRPTLEIQAEKAAKHNAQLEKEKMRGADIVQAAENLQEKVLRPRKGPQAVNKLPGKR